MKNEILFIMGSSRSDGNTRKVVDFLLKKLPSDLLDLTNYKFSYYDYEYKNANDDFLKLANVMLQYDKIVFCTPVYWYAMSAVMKTFFDRFSDMVTTQKSLGRKLAGKKMYALCCSSDAEEHDGFFMPFEKTAEYLDMIYGGAIHTWIETDKIPVEVKKRLMEFSEKIARS